MELSFYPIADSYLLVAAIGLALVMLLVLFSLGIKTSGRKLLALIALRLGVIGLAMLAMLRPTLVYTETTKEKATLVLLADRSRSMSVRDGLGGRSRWDALTAALEEAAPALKELDRDFEIKAYGFDAETHSLEVKSGRVALPEAPQGEQTAIGAALEDVLRQEGGKRLLGVVLLTDGRQQARPPRDAAPQNVANRLRHQGDAVYPVVFGQPRGRGSTQDLAVTQMLPENPRVFVKNVLTVSGQVSVSGYVNRPVPVRLWFETSPGKMEVVGQQNVKATADGQLVPVEFTYIPQMPGEFKVTLEVVPQAGELVTTNNLRSTFVDVLKGGLNVLYIEGAVRTEQKFLRRALDASRDIKVDTIRLDQRQPQPAAELADVFRPGKYEVYILGDVEAAAFSGDELKQLAEAVDRGSGLIALGGFRSFGAGGYWNTPLADVLPIVMDRLEQQRAGDPIRRDLHLNGPVQMRPNEFGRRHFALMFSADPRENMTLWSMLPPLKGANKFFAVKRRGATVLADADGDPTKPLLVTQTWGTGRVLAFAGDSTWRWWLRGQEALSKRFWRQIVLWLARKDQAAEGSAWVRLEKRRFGPGERVDFSVGAQSPDGEPVRDAEFKAEIILPDGKRVSTLLVRQGEKTTGAFRDTQPAGDYAVEVTAARKGEPPGKARARFSVLPQDLELDDASSDPDAMKGLAERTGGRVVVPEELSALIRDLVRQTPYLEVPQRTTKTFWDKWPFFLSLVGLLCLEWYFRKRWGMV